MIKTFSKGFGIEAKDQKTPEVGTGITVKEMRSDGSLEVLPEHAENEIEFHKQRISELETEV